MPKIVPSVFWFINVTYNVSRFSVKKKKNNFSRVFSEYATHLQRQGRIKTNCINLK